jgi:hypothetical protein
LGDGFYGLFVCFIHHAACACRVTRHQGIIVIKLVLAAALALTFSATVHAKAIELETRNQSARAHVPAQPHPSRAGAPHGATVVLSSRISELPEPEVFAMMLVGLVLIGYRASRDSDEKFK